MYVNVNTCNIASYEIFLILIVNLLYKIINNIAFNQCIMEKSEIVNEIHKPARVNFPRRKYKLFGIDDLFEADLIEVRNYAKQNKNFNYILTVINCFSKFAYCEPLKTKTGKEVTVAFKKILKRTTPPKNLHVDQGKEFFNSHFQKLMKKYKINIYPSYSTKKCAIIERFNRTLKNMLYKQFSLNGSYKWVDILQKMVAVYNNKTHRTIAMAPSEVTKAHEEELLKTAYNNQPSNQKKWKKKIFCW